MAIEYFRPRYGGPKQRAKRAGEYRGRTAFVVGGRRTTGQNRGGPKQRASEVQRSETPRSKVTPSTGTCKYFKTFGSRALRAVEPGPFDPTGIARTCHLGETGARSVRTDPPAY